MLAIFVVALCLTRGMYLNKFPKGPGHRISQTSDVAPTRSKQNMCRSKVSGLLCTSGMIIYYI